VLSSISDPISQIPFRVIRSTNPSDIRELSNWVWLIVARLDLGGFVTISFDTEGFQPPICLQFCEVYDSTFDLFSFPHNPPPIAPRQGFIVVFPLAPSVATLLSRVFSHSRIALLAFEFTQDLTVLENAGVSVNLSRLLDCQVSSVEPEVGQGFLETTRVRGLAWVINHAIDERDPLLVQAKEKMDKSMNWDAIEYVRQKGEMGDLVSKEGFLKYAAADVILTALACTALIRKSDLERTVGNTQMKAAEFRRCQETRGKWGPIFVRKMAFFAGWGAEDFKKVEEDVGATSDWGKLLKLWSWAICLRDGYRLMGRGKEAVHLFLGFRPEVAEAKREALERILDLHLDAIREAAFANFK
jgi:hypothetical protein